MILQRGDVIKIADRGGEFTGKPRPAVIVQAVQFAGLESVTVCPITSFFIDAPLVRLPLDPSPDLMLDRRSWVEVDKITTIYLRRIGGRIGRVTRIDMQRLSNSLAVFLGLV